MILLLLRFEVFKSGQIGLILLKHLVDHLLDLGQREHGGGQRVVGNGLVDQAWVAGQAAFDRHLFDLRR